MLNTSVGAGFWVLSAELGCEEEAARLGEGSMGCADTALHHSQGGAGISMDVLCSGALGGSFHVPFTQQMVREISFMLGELWKGLQRFVAHCFSHRMKIYTHTKSTQKINCNSKGS